MAQQFPAEFWEVSSASLFPVRMSFIAVHPTNPKYGIYLNHGTKSPEKVYGPRLDHFLGEIFATQKEATIHVYARLSSDLAEVRKSLEQY